MHSKLLILLTIIAYTHTFPLYDNNNSNVVNLNRKNFDTQIIKPRAKNQISLVHFYKQDDLKSQGIKPELNKLASEQDGMFKIAAIDCGEFKDLCEKYEIKEFPTKVKTLN